MQNDTWRLAVSALLLAATLAASKAIDSRRAVALDKPLETLSANIAGWRAETGPDLAPVILEQLKASSYLSRTYRRGPEEAIGLFIAYYSQQRAGENMHSPRACLPGNGWKISEQGTTWAPTGGRPIEVNLYRIQNAADRRVILYWYQNRKRIIAGEYKAKVFLIWDSVREGDTSGALVRVTLPETPGAVETGAHFAAALFPEVQRCLGR
jgi:EpsI family protein